MITEARREQEQGHAIWTYTADGRGRRSRKRHISALSIQCCISTACVFHAKDEKGQETLIRRL